MGTDVADRPNPLNLPVSATDAAIRIMQQTICQYHNTREGRVQAWSLPFSPQYASSELLKAARNLADRYHTGLTTHHNYSPQALDQWLGQLGRPPAQYLEDIGVLGPNVLLAHALALRLEEVDRLARTGARVVTCPTATIKGRPA